MSTEPFIGEIKILSFDFAPKNYLLCAGQILAISTNTALFSLLGTTYGGNGMQTFALPDLRGRMPISQGTSNYNESFSMGEVSGIDNTTLLSINLPPHTHSAQNIKAEFPVSIIGGDTDSPANAFLTKTSTDFYSSISTSGSTSGRLQVGGQTGIAGVGIPFSVMNPYLAINYSIAIYGIFPSRN